MAIGELLKKMAKGQQLSFSEIERLRLWGNNAESHNSYTQALQSGAAVVVKPFIERPLWFGGSPLDALTFQRTTDVTISDSTNTYITFETTYGQSDNFSLDSSDLSKLLVRHLGTPFMLFGYANWTANATGYRGLWVEGFTAQDASLGTSPLHTSAGQALVDNVLPFAYAAGSQQFPKMTYLKFYVHQTSTGNLDLKDLVCNISIT